MEYNLENEQSIISSILLKNSNILKLNDELQGNMFYEKSYGIVFEKIKESFLLDKKEDLITLKTLIETFEIKDSWKHFVKLSGVVSINGKEYSNYIIEEWKKRELKNTLEKIDYSKNYTIIENKITDCLLKQDDSNGFLDAGDFVKIFNERVEKLLKDGTDNDRIATGYYKIDSIFKGISKTELTLIAGRPSMGKTAWAVNLAFNIATNKKKVAFFSLEMAGEKIIERMTTLSAGLESKAYFSKQESDATDFIKASKKLSDLDIKINDSSNLTADSIYLQTKKMIAKSGVDVIFIDHLSYIKILGRQNLSFEIGKVTKILKSIAKELKVAVVLLVQLNRDSVSDNSKSPQLHHLRQSGEIEQDADVVFFVHRPEYYLERDEPVVTDQSKYEKWQKSISNWRNVMQIICAKNRDGSLGNVNLNYNLTTQRIDNEKH